jgi:hypothetical protein
VWGRERLLISVADLTWTADQLALCLRDPENITLAMFPNLTAGLLVDGRLQHGQSEGIFTTYTFRQPPHKIPVSVQEIVTNPLGGRQWDITLPAEALQTVNDVFLHIDFEGDVAQLFLDDTLIADWFYDGTTWEIGLKRFAERLRKQKLRLFISPLLEEARIYLEARPQFVHGRACVLKSITAIPQYQVSIRTVE